MASRSERFRARRKALNAATRDDLIPWLLSQGFENPPFFGEKLGSYYPGIDIWTYYVARLERPDLVCQINIYVGPDESVQLTFNWLTLSTPVDRLSDMPVIMAENEGVLDTRHLRNALPRHGRPFRRLGLHFTDRYAPRRWRNHGGEIARIMRLLKEDIAAREAIYEEWSRTRTPAMVGPDGRVVEPGQRS